jgi:hypothetical protein
VSLNRWLINLNGIFRKLSGFSPFVNVASPYLVPERRVTRTEKPEMYVKIRNTLHCVCDLQKFTGGFVNMPVTCRCRHTVTACQSFDLGLTADQSAKYDFASSNTTRTTIAFDVCFVWKIAPLADERSGFFIENLLRRLTRSSTY